MTVKPLKYNITENVIESVSKTVIPEAKIDTKKWKKTNKGKCLVAIQEEQKTLTYIAPIVNKETLYGGLIPIPSSLFYFQAKQFSDSINHLLEKFPENITLTFKDSDGDNFNMIDSDLYYTFLSYKITTITSLVMFIESFLNAMIPNDFTALNRKGEVINKEVIERKWGLKEKLKDVIPQIIEIENLEEYQTQYSKFLELTNLRNEFIHMKTTRNQKNMDPFIDHFQSIINIDLKVIIADTENLVLMMDENYFN